jgi:hypothetical protein
MDEAGAHVLTFLSSADAVGLLLLSRTVRARLVGSATPLLCAAWCALFERDVAALGELSRTIRWIIALEFTHSEEDAAHAFVDPIVGTLKLDVPDVEVWIQLLAGQSVDAAAEIAAAHEAAAEIAAPTDGRLRFAHAQLDPREWSLPTRRHNARVVRLIEAHRLAPALRLRNAVAYIGRRGRRFVRDGRSPARWRPFRSEAERLRYLVRFATRYGLGGALTRVLGAVAKESRAPGPDSRGLARWASSNYPLAAKATSNVPTAKWEAFVIAAALGHVDCARRLVRAAGELALVSGRGARAATAFSIVNNLPDVLAMLVVECGSDAAYFEQLFPRRSWEAGWHGIARHLLCGDFDGESVADARWSGGYDATAFASATGAARARERRRCTFGAKQVMLARLARLGLSLDLFAPMLSDRYEAAFLCGGGGDDGGRGGGRSGGRGGGRGEGGEGEGEGGYVALEVGLQRIGFGNATLTRPCAVAAQLVYDAVAAHNAALGASIGLRDWRAHVHALWASAAG